MICNITPSRRAADAAWLSERIAQSNVPVQQVPGFTGPKPMPARSNVVDPETVLKRRRPVITAKYRRILREMAEAL